jgi:hypothetical protein
MNPTLQKDQVELALYIDESGSPKPNPKDSAKYFALGGVLLERQNELVVESAISDFKQRWEIDKETPLHGNEIRSKKNKFAWLGKLSQQQQENFQVDLTQTITSLPIAIHACVVSRTGYLDRYFAKYGQQTWGMMRSAFAILVERSAKYAMSKDGNIMIYHEKAGKKEDRLFKEYFQELRSSGHPFDTTNASKYLPLGNTELAKHLLGIEGKSKQNPILQVADLCLYPIARSKEELSNQAYVAMKEAGILVDCHLPAENLETLGIKYYCFNNG